TAESNTRTPPLAIAPNAVSSWPGTPSFRTTNTSSGTPNATATSYATGTPPRGKPRTRTLGSRAYCRSFPANARPASCRSTNGFGMMHQGVKDDGYGATALAPRQSVEPRHRVKEALT